MNTTCPYCDHPITPRPKHGRPCPHCGEKFSVRAGELYTWAGARERDRAKRRGYELVSRFCPNCGDIMEAGEKYFKRITPCEKCRHYIDWHHGHVMKWSKVAKQPKWYNRNYPVPPDVGITLTGYPGVLGFIQLTEDEDDGEEEHNPDGS